MSPRLALLLGLADAQDRARPAVERGRHLELERAVGLAEELAPLGVAEDDAVHVELDSIAADTSPVKAPSGFSCMFWANI